MPTLNSADLRIGELARAAGYSTQQIRNLERDGVLPSPGRTAGGYRVYTELHRHHVLAYRALAAGCGPVLAKRVLRAARDGSIGDALALLDEVHAGLAAERRDLQLARRAVDAIGAEPIADPRPDDAMSISELSGALGVRTSTLRHWETEGLLVADRDEVRGSRRYSPIQVRDARIVHQLRLAGYRIPPLREAMTRLRGLPSAAPDLDAALRTRSTSITTRSRALLDGAAALSAALARTASDSG